MIGCFSAPFSSRWRCEIDVEFPLAGVASPAQGKIIKVVDGLQKDCGSHEV